MIRFSALLIVLATFTFTSFGLQQEGLIFYETFDANDDAFNNGWVKSNHPKYENQPIKVKPPIRTIPGFENDKGIQLTQEMKHYGFAAKFDHPMRANGSDIVIQYELKLEESLACGGAYVKVLRADRNLDIASLSNETPYVIMFGPDKCGTNSKVQFILKHRNPVTKKWSEHHFNGEMKPKLDRSTHLYTLVIHSNNEFEVHIDTKPVARGSLLHDLQPPINPPEEVNDPLDRKPADWVDEAFIPDPSAVKPEDWDESQPRRVLALGQERPADWDEGLPVMVPDPRVTQPTEWDDEEDGHWEAPQIPNPACEKLSGCGPWAPPLVDNPLYKGRWVPPLVPNSLYKGVWAPRKIKNPFHFVDASPYASIPPMGALAVEVWTTSAGILFDNFAVACDSAAALAFAQQTTALKAHAERELIQREEREALYQEQLHLLETGTLLERAQTCLELVLGNLQERMPIVLPTGAALLLGMMLSLFFCPSSHMFTGGQSTKGKKAGKNSSNEVDRDMDRKKPTETRKLDRSGIVDSKVNE